MTSSTKNIGHRLQAFIDYLGISNNKFGNSIGISGSIVSHMINGNNFGVDKLIKILNNYPELNIEWLVSGKGPMLKELQQTEIILNKKNDLQETISEMENKHLREQLRSKENELNSQVALNKALQEIIQMMKK